MAFRLGFGPRGWDLGIKTEIWAPRLGFEGGDGEEGEEEEEQVAQLQYVAAIPVAVLSMFLTVGDG